MVVLFANPHCPITQAEAQDARQARYTKVMQFTVLEAGGLTSYGPRLAGAWQQAGVHAGQVLAGTKPADLPTQQLAFLELEVDLKTAKPLGLPLSQSITARADEVIE